jgi:threonine/homoserine/homoserine lactone efflux protein
MGPAISDILPLAVAVMISPIPIIGIILVLFSSKARTDGPAFLLGWVAGLAVLSTVVYLIADSANASSNSDASDTTSTVKVVLGVLLILMARREWKKRPAPGEQATLPKWMGAIDQLTPVKSLGLGVLLSAVNPKNLILTVGAAASVAQLGTSTSDAVVALAVFVIIGSLGIVVPLVGYFVGGEKAKRVLDTWKAWLQQNNVAVMTVLLLVIGVVLLAKGLGLLTA